jgi:hypothetical protein
MFVCVCVCVCVCARAHVRVRTRYIKIARDFYHLWRRRGTIHLNHFRGGIRERVQYRTILGRRMICQLNVTEKSRADRVVQQRFGLILFLAALTIPRKKISF